MHEHMTLRASYDTRKQSVAMLPLAGMLLLHLMLVLLWPTTARLQGDRDVTRRYVPLRWIPAPPPRTPPLQAPARPTSAAARDVRTPAAPAPGAPALAPSSAEGPSSVQEEPPQRNTAPAASAPAAVDAQPLTELARRQAGAIDRELRQGKLVPLTPDPDLPIHRFRRALESAHIDSSRTVVTDTLIQPDGVIVYRFRLGGRVWCRQSGGGAPGMLERTEGAKLAGAGSAGGGSAAGTIQCPSGEAGWAR